MVFPDTLHACAAAVHFIHVTTHAQQRTTIRCLTLQTAIYLFPALAFAQFLTAVLLLLVVARSPRCVDVPLPLTRKTKWRSSRGKNCVIVATLKPSSFAAQRY